MTARQQGRCSRRSAVALASNIITYFAYMRLHLQFYWLCGMLSSCGAAKLCCCVAGCPQSGEKAKQKKRRTCAVSHPHRWLLTAVAACCCMPHAACCLLHAPTIASFWANEKQFWCSNYVSRDQCRLHCIFCSSSLLESFVLHMTKMLAASVKDRSSSCCSLKCLIITVQLTLQAYLHFRAAQNMHTFSGLIY